MLQRREDQAHPEMARYLLALLCGVQGMTTLAIDLNLTAEVAALFLLLVIVALFRH
jgi:hypothetical protein